MKILFSAAFLIRAHLSNEQIHLCSNCHCYLKNHQFYPGLFCANTLKIPLFSLFIAGIMVSLLEAAWANQFIYIGCPFHASHQY